MTEANDGHFPDPETLDDEEKVELIHGLHAALHEVNDTNIALANALTSSAWAMDTLAAHLMQGDSLGKRHTAMVLTALKLRVLAATTYSDLGISAEDLRETDAFASIVADLESDPAFNGSTFDNGGKDADSSDA